MLKYIVALLLLNGCRERELLDAKWKEVNLDRKVWRIPTSKSGRPHHVPLSEDAIAVFRELLRFGNYPYIVPNPKTLKPFTAIYNSWDSARRTCQTSGFMTSVIRPHRTWSTRVSRFTLSRTGSGTPARELLNGTPIWTPMFFSKR